MACEINFQKLRAVYQNLVCSDWPTLTPLVNTRASLTQIRNATWRVRAKVILH